jgi:hypothetical protein
MRASSICHLHFEIEAEDNSKIVRFVLMKEVNYTVRCKLYVI